MELAQVNSKIQNAETEKKLAVSEATKEIEKERDNLVNDLKIKDKEKELLKKSIEEQFSTKLIGKDETIKMKDDEIERLRDFKQKQSTKMVGETLEIHCISKGDALDMKTNHLTSAFISGRKISLETHQTELWKRYSKKYQLTN